MGTASLRSRGPTCSGTASAAAWLRQCSPSATERSGSGPRCVTSSLPPASNAAGSTRSPTSSTRTQVRTARREGRAGRDLERRRPRARRGRCPLLRGRVRHQVAQGGREGHRRPRRAAGVLRLPRRALGPPAYHEPGRVDLRHRPPSAAGHQGPGSRAAGVAMAFKLIESAQQRWRAVNAPHLVALVRAGARFEKGLLVERPDESGGDQQVA